MTSALVLWTLLCGAAATPVTAPAAALPDDPARPLVRGRCLTCHSVDYLTQQRLTAVQWEKTVEKMRKFGAAVSDGEVKQISAYLARSWPADAPETRPAPVTAPRGAVTAPAPRR